MPAMQHDAARITQMYFLFTIFPPKSIIHKVFHYFFSLSIIQLCGLSTQSLS